MKKKIIIFITFFMISLSPFAEKTVNQKIADLEKKLKNVSGIKKVDVLNDLGYEYYRISPKKCIEYGSQALKLSQKIGYSKGEAKGLKNIGIGNYLLGNYKSAIENYLKSMKISEEIGDKKGIASSLSNIGIVYEAISDYKKALEYLMKALKIFEEIEDKKGFAKTLNNIGMVYFYLFNYDKSLEYHLKSLKIFEEIGDKRGTFHPLLNIGNVYSYLNNYEKALEYYFKTLKISEEIGDKNGISIVSNNVGFVYYHLSNCEKALEYHLKSLKIDEEIGDKKGIAISLNNIGTVQEKLSNYKKALNYYKKSLKISEEIGLKSNIAKSLHNIAVIYSQLGNYAKALEYLKKSLKLAKKIGNKHGVASSLNGIGKTYIKLKNYNKGLKNLKQGLKIAREIKAKDEIRNSYEGLSELYAAKKEFKSAYEYHKLFHEEDKSIFNEESNKKIADLQIRYETEKKEMKIEALEKDKEIQELRFNRIRITRNAFIISFLLVLIILVLLFKRYLYLFAFWKKKVYVGQYMLQGKIGSGGMGAIFEAHSIRDKTLMAAVKILKMDLIEKDKMYVKRFEYEAKIIDQLDHPNIIKIFERGQHKQTIYIAMELLKGITLDKKMEQGRIVLMECLHIIFQIVDALVVIHEKNILHRDLKPGNIMLIEKDGDSNFVKLLDFGLAKAIDMTKLTQTGKLWGSPRYMSPEQFELDSGQLTTASDIYSFGIIIYEMITGISPYQKTESHHIKDQITEGKIKPPIKIDPQIPEKLNQLVIKMIEIKPEKRPDAIEIREEVKKLKAFNFNS